MAQSFAWSGAGMWAVEAPGVSPCIGAVGLLHVGFDAHFTPAVEVGWRLARAYWGQGYATEAGAASLRYGFDELGLDEIVSFTAEVNLPSQAVDGPAWGCTGTPRGDFDHPRIPAGHPLSHHVLFRLHRARLAGRPGLKPGPPVR